MDDIKTSNTESQVDKITEDIEKTNKCSDSALTELTEESVTIPIPSVVGNLQIEILKNGFIKEKDTDKYKGVSINLKNISGYHIGRAIFQVVFYDNKGDVIERFEKDTWDFESNSSRILAIYPNAQNYNSISSYDIRLLRVIMSPVPSAVGNDKIEILSHVFLAGNNPFGSPIKGGGVELSVKNKTDETISTTVYNAVFYDLEGNVIDTVRYKDFELKPHSSRAIVIESDKLIGEPARCYSISIIKALTTDVEKIIILSHERHKIPSGEEKISGLLKNISNSKSDAAIIATFMDYQNEKVGTRVLLVKDIEPYSTKKFSFLFNNPQGDKIKSYSIDIGNMDEV